jgi:hypothetical protein
MRALVIDPLARDTSDGVLVAGCLAGDDLAWHTLIGRYARLVDAVIRRYHLSADEHDDIFQDVTSGWRSGVTCRRSGVTSGWGRGW